MAVRVVTDSTADIPPEVTTELGVTVVPTNLHFGAETLRDGVDIQAEEFYQRLVTSSRLPTTSQPAPGTFLEVYSNLVENGDQVVSIHISGKLSRTVNSALLAREQLSGKGQVEVVDTLLASAPVGLVVMAACHAAQAGATLEQVVEVAHRTAEATQLFVMVDTLEYLQKGGRIGKAQALLGSLLRIKPILTTIDGEIHPLERARTRSKAIKRLYQIAQERAPLSNAAVCHSTTPDEAEVLREHLASLCQGSVFVSRFGPVVGTHLGPGALGMALQRQ